VWKKSEVWKNKKFRILLIFEALLLLVGILGLIPGDRLAADSSAMEVNLAAGSCPGESGEWYIDESFGFGGRFLEMYPPVLKPGVYTLRIVFDAGDNGSCSFGIEDRDGCFRGLRSNEVSLYSGVSVQECQFYVMSATKKAEVFVNYGGAGALTVKNIELVHTNAGSRILIFLVVVFSALVNTLIMLYCYMGKYRVEAERKLVWFGIPALAVLASIPLFTDYMIIGADAIFHWMRIEALARSIVCGDIPARIEEVWLYGHGYANSIFYCDTLLTVPALLRLLGFDMNVSYGIFVFLVNLATAWVAYISFRGCFGRRSLGMLGSLLYTLAPYRIYNIYNRCAVGEYTAMIFLPLLCYGFYLLFTEDIHKKEYKRYWLIPVAGFSGIIQSHVLTCEITGAFVILLCVILIRKVFRRQTFLELIKVVAGTVALNLWFLLPFLDMTVSDEYYFSHNAGNTIQNRGVLPAHFIYTMQAAGGNSRFHEQGLLDTEPIGVGFAILLGTAAFFIARRLWEPGENEKRQDKAAVVAFILGAAGLVMSTGLFPWNAIQGAGKVTGMLVPMLQFPTRLTIIPTVCFVFVACTAALGVERSGNVLLKRGFSVLLCAGCIVFSLYQTNDTLLVKSGVMRLYSAQGMGHSAILGGEYLPLGTNGSFQYHEAEPSGGVTVSAYEKEGLNTLTELSVREEKGEHYVELPLLYYKGYRAQDMETGQRFEAVPGDNYEIRVMLPAGYQGTLRTWYAGMWYWRLAEAVSFLSFAALAVAGLCRRFVKV